jgi:signal transduction histidine kinase
MGPEPELASILARTGYVFILFLPTCLYHFLIEIKGWHQDLRWVYLSYILAGLLAVLALLTNGVINGTYPYYFGPFPQAGVLHPLHILQTGGVVMRGLYLAYRARPNLSQDPLVRLGWGLVSVMVSLGAASDYLCSYGVALYPPGGLFLAIGLGFMTYAVAQRDLMAPWVAAATVAHEVRTPLARIAMQADYLQTQIPALVAGYQAAVAHGLVEQPVGPAELSKLDRLLSGISQQVGRCNMVIDMLMTSIKADKMDGSTFANHRMSEVVQEAIDSFPFTASDRKAIRIETCNDFEFHGSRALLVFVLFNLIKNALYAIKQQRKGEIHLSLQAQGKYNLLCFRDTGPGISEQSMPKIFDTYFTTKGNAGLGIGLPFCRRVIRSFGGDMQCESQSGAYTLFTLKFPARGGSDGVS